MHTTRLPITTLSLLAASFTASVAAGQEPAAPGIATPPAPASPSAPPNPDRRAVDLARADAIGDLKDRIKLAELQGRYEQTLRDNERAREARPSLLEPRPIGEARILFPSLFGLVASYAGPVGAVGIMTGPLSFTSGQSSRGDRWQQATFAPSADVVVDKRWTVGGTVLGMRTTGAQGTLDGYLVGAAPRVGLLVPLGAGLTFWPELGLQVARYRTEMSLGSGDQTSRSLGWLVTPQAHASLALPIARHVFLRVGTGLSYSTTTDEAAQESRDVVQLSSDMRVGLML